jgi:hypothetical protein
MSGDMRLSDMQSDMRRAYVGGGPGVFISSLVWCAAGLVERNSGAGPGFAALFFGGMLIFPLGTLLSRLVFRRKGEQRGNALGGTALESTIAMIAAFLPAFLFLNVRPDYVFPLAALAVGAHYFVFRTVYGDMLFWALAALISAAALLEMFTAINAPFGFIFLIAAIELVFAIVLTLRGVLERQ